MQRLCTHELGLESRYFAFGVPIPLCVSVHVCRRVLQMCRPGANIMMENKYIVQLYMNDGRTDGEYPKYVCV